MTYCLGMLLDRGLVMMADTRTNAGVDNFSSYRKLHCLLDEPGRQIYAATAGNLSTSQTVISLLREGIPADDDQSLTRSLSDVSSMFRAAQLVGEAVHMANEAVGEALAALNILGTSCLLLGGRIGKEPPRLFMVYEAGNFIECTPEVPFLQIGETKYGRPILDRVIKADTPLAEAIKIGLLSFDSSMRSNLAVARPLDLIVMERDADRPVLTRRIGADDSYFNDLSSRWSRLLHEATRAIPDPPFMLDLTS
jgi:putative proteasome-type protease